MKICSRFVLVALAALLISQFANADVGNTATQQNCIQSGDDSAPLMPTSSVIWANAGLNRNIDRVVYKRVIVAYKIRWSTGWSKWYVKGVNDLYAFATPSLATPGAIDARLAWIYFYDHAHQYISCD